MILLSVGLVNLRKVIYLNNIYYPPQVFLEPLREVGLESTFASIKKIEVKAHYQNDEISEPFVVSLVDRKLFDGVAILAYTIENNNPMIYLRSCVRPAAMLRSYEDSQLPEGQDVGNFYELPAGLIEEQEKGIDGIFSAASRELWEEVGIKVEPKKFKNLGTRIFPMSGLCAERIFFVLADVTGLPLDEPPGDGWYLEKYPSIQKISLIEAIKLSRQGYFPEADKTKRYLIVKK